MVCTCVLNTRQRDCSVHKMLERTLRMNGAFLFLVTSLTQLVKAVSGHPMLIDRRRCHLSEEKLLER